MNPRDTILAGIALEWFSFPSLETRRGPEDFKETAVWCVKAALEAAYEAGMAAGRRNGRRS